MGATILRKADQASGAFDGGAILEHKPIGFPQDGGPGRPVGSLFYWANAWSEPGGLIGLHPHQGFEILSVVLAGGIEHYDTAYDRWLGLSAGDAQIIRAGQGVSHAEKILPHSRMFQIWFDPDLSVSLGEPAAYEDYRADQWVEEGWPTGGRVRWLRGPAPTGDPGAVGKDRATEAIPRGPLRMRTDAYLFRLDLAPGRHLLDTTEGRRWAAFALEGRAQIEHESGTDSAPLPTGPVSLGEGDFILGDGTSWTLQASTATTLFVVELPLEPGYVTYAQQRRR